MPILKHVQGDPAKLFLLCGGVFGLIWTFLFPPLMVIDEGSHFYRAYQIAEGHILGMKNHDVSGGTLPTSVWEFANHSGYHYGYMDNRYDKKANTKDIFNESKRKLEPRNRTFVVFNNTVVYPPITYLPQAVGIRFSLLFQASPLISLYCARLAMLAFWLACLYFTIRLLPFGKWVAFAAGLFPMALSPAASASSDGTINALSFLAAGLILHAIYSERINAKLLAAISAVGIALALTKLPYVLIMLFALALPASRFPRRIGKGKFLLALLVLLSSRYWYGII